VLSIETLNLDSSITDISTVKKFLTLQKPTSRPHICTQGGGEVGGGFETAPPPRKSFEKLVYKNAIKPKKVDLPRQFFLKALTPL
jgi:hypothetical protein